MLSKFYSVHQDAFSSGQVDSKLWLCEKLEKSGIKSKEIAIYGGWYGMTGFLLLSRGIFNVERIRSYDIDPDCEVIADMINANWIFHGWKFKAFTEDCNKIIPTADLIINTSTEHFDSLDWWNNIPIGTAVALQGNDMIHEDHSMCASNLDEFCERFPVQTNIYKGELKFTYTDWGFTRYMLIGIK